MKPVSVNKLIEDREYKLEMRILSGEENLDRVITDSSIHKLGLALAGIHFSLSPGEIQLMGASEMAYLQMLSPRERGNLIKKLLEFDFPCLIVTRGLDPHPDLLAALSTKQIPCLQSSLETAEFIGRLNRFIDDHLAPRIAMHGVLIDVTGIGVLLMGQSGIGKSETALDLVLKGHRLVADDIVEIYRSGKSSLVGRSSEMIEFHMEIRGLGIINIQDLYGITATRDHKRIDAVIELVEWEEGVDYDRLGLEEEKYHILGLELPHIKIPVGPGRNLSSLIEVAARNQLLKKRGHHSAREFQQRLLQGLKENGEDIPPSADEVE